MASLGRHCSSQEMPGKTQAPRKAGTEHVRLSNPQELAGRLSMLVRYHSAVAQSGHLRCWRDSFQLMQRKERLYIIAALDFSLNINLNFIEYRKQAEGLLFYVAYPNWCIQVIRTRQTSCKRICRSYFSSIQPFQARLCMMGHTAGFGVAKKVIHKSNFCTRTKIVLETKK